MMKCYNKLECVVRYSAGKGRCKTATEIAIFIGPLLVAIKTMGGRYTPEQGLAEFQRNPKPFAKLGGFEMAKELKLVA
jgi:hypothetical protein